MSIFRAFSARFGSIFGKVYENFPKAFSAGEFRTPGPTWHAVCVDQAGQGLVERCESLTTKKSKERHNRKTKIIRRNGMDSS